MKRYWNRLSDRVAKLQLRERVIVLAAMLLLIYFAIDALLFAPTHARLKAARGQYAEYQGQMSALSAQLQATARAGAADPDAANLARLAELRRKHAQLEAQAKERSSQIISAQRMRSVLQQLLASRPGLRLVELKTLPAVAIAVGGEPPKQEAGATPSIGAAPSMQEGTRSQEGANGGARQAPPEDGRAQGALYKHGIQLTVHGRYLDLLAYLKQIEALPVTLYWDKAELSVVDHPTLALTFTLYTVSLDKAWIQV